MKSLFKNLRAIAQSQDKSCVKFPRLLTSLLLSSTIFTGTSFLLAVSPALAVPRMKDWCGTLWSVENQNTLAWINPSTGTTTSGSGPTSEITMPGGSMGTAVAANGIHTQSGTMFVFDRTGTTGTLYKYRFGVDTTWQAVPVSGLIGLSGTQSISGASNNLNKMAVVGNTLLIAESNGIAVYSIPLNSSGAVIGSPTVNTYTYSGDPGSYQHRSATTADPVGTEVINGGDLTIDEYGDVYNITYNVVVTGYVVVNGVNQQQIQTTKAFFYKQSGNTWVYQGETSATANFAGAAFYRGDLYVKSALQLKKVDLTRSGSGYTGWNNTLINIGAANGIGTGSADLAGCGTPVVNMTKTQEIYADAALTTLVSNQTKVQTGQYIKYTIAAKNVGDSWARNTTINDSLPTGTTYVPNSATLNGTNLGLATYPTSGFIIDSPGSASGVIPYTPNPDTATLSFVVQVTATNGAVQNRATIAYIDNANIPSETPVCTSTPKENCVDSPSASVVAPVTISGTVWDDANNSANNTFSNIQNGAETGTNGGGLNAILVNSTGNAIATTPVAADGTYSFSNVAANQTGVKIILSTTAGTIGSVAPAASVPSNWINTSPLTTPAFDILTSSIAGKDFGIKTFSAPVSITCPVGSTATGSGYATGGLGQYLTQNAIYWLDWSCGTTTQFNPGDTVTKTWTAPNGISITATLGNITKTLAPYNTGSWSGDKLDDLYNGVNPIGLINVNASEDPSYEVTFSMTLNGVPIPSDIVTAEAEDTGWSNEFATWTTDGDPWEPLEAAPNSSLKATFSNGGQTIYMDDNPDHGGGVLVALTENVSNITVNMNAGGNEAIAFGIFVPFDYGDAPSSYSSAPHYTRRHASGGSKPTSPTNVNSLTMATLSYNSPYLGAIGADPERVALPASPGAVATGDNTNGFNDEDAFTTLPNVSTSGTYSLNNIPVNNTTGSTATLYAWVDFNKNGIFEASEFTSIPVNNGATTANLSWTVPAGTTAGSTYARFRLTTSALSDNAGTTNVDERATATANNGEVEDYSVTIAGSPNVLLVKRITAINGGTTTFGGNSLDGYIDVPTNAYDDNNITIPTQTIPTDPPKDTDKWPTLNSFMLGGINGGNVKPGDEMEYTIYFLSTGDSTAKNVLICDRIPENATFMPTAFNSFATKNTTGLPSGDRGIIWQNNDVTESLTNISDGDTAEYLSPGVDPTIKYPGIKCDGTNTNGVVVVKLGNIPNATAPGIPTSSYGFIRFQGRIK